MDGKRQSLIASTLQALYPKNTHVFHVQGKRVEKFFLHMENHVESVENRVESTYSAFLEPFLVYQITHI